MSESIENFRRFDYLTIISLLVSMFCPYEKRDFLWSFNRVLKYTAKNGTSSASGLKTSHMLQVNVPKNPDYPIMHCP